MLNKIVPFLIRQKVYIDRARMYAGYLTIPSLLLILLKTFGVPVTPIYVVAGLPALLVLMIIIGRIEIRVGAYQAEASRHASLNPFYSKLTEQLESIQAQLLHLRSFTTTNAQLEAECLIDQDKNLKEIHAQINATNDKIVRIIRLLQK